MVKSLCWLRTKTRTFTKLVFSFDSPFKFAIVSVSERIEPQEHWSSPESLSLLVPIEEKTPAEQKPWKRREVKRFWSTMIVIAVVDNHLISDLSVTLPNCTTFYFYKTKWFPSEHLAHKWRFSQNRFFLFFQKNKRSSSSSRLFFFGKDSSSGRLMKTQKSSSLDYNCQSWQNQGTSVLR